MGKRFNEFCWYCYLKRCKLRALLQVLVIGSVSVGSFRLWREVYNACRKISWPCSHNIKAKLVCLVVTTCKRKREFARTPDHGVTIQLWRRLHDRSRRRFCVVFRSIGERGASGPPGSLTGNRSVKGRSFAFCWPLALFTPGFLRCSSSRSRSSISASVLKAHSMAILTQYLQLMVTRTSENSGRRIAAWGL